MAEADEYLNELMEHIQHFISSNLHTIMNVLSTQSSSRQVEHSISNGHSTNQHQYTQIAEISPTNFYGKPAQMENILGFIWDSAVHDNHSLCDIQK